MSAVEEDLPAYALGVSGIDALPRVALDVDGVDADWVWGGSTGAGVKVAIVDSGIDADHPRVAGPVARAVAPRATEEGEREIVDDDAGDLSGHGTACAGIVRSLAPECELWSVRVLGGEISGTGRDLLAGLRWAIEAGADVVNLSLSTRKRRFYEDFCELADLAAFANCVIVCSAHNLPVESWPWMMGSVISVGGHTGSDPFALYVNTIDPPVELYAPGVDVEIAWADGETIRASGNSFATPHVAGLAARIVGKHPGLRPFEVKTLLAQAARKRGMSALQPTVDIARALFGAKAASIMLREGDELVFAAVSGDGEGQLEGRRIPVSTGVAGWVVTSRQAIQIEDVRSDPRFAAEVAQSTGYVPHGLMAAPIEDHDERIVGVLSVLDRPLRREFSLIELELLARLADQAAGLVGAAAPVAVPEEVRRLVEALAGLDKERRAAAGELLSALTRLL